MSSSLKPNLLEAEHYLAHSPAEKLTAHVTRTNQYLKELISIHHLDPVIDNLIQGLSKDLDPEKANYIKTLFINTIAYHDLGKINERFQTDKLNNPHFKSTAPKDSPLGSTHSALGAFIYLCVHLDEIITKKGQDTLLITVCLCLSYFIFKHHNKQLDDDYLLTLQFDEPTAFMSQYLEKFQLNIDPRIINLVGKKKFVESRYLKQHTNTFDLYALCRLNFSLLTAADYLATNEYMNAMPIADFGIFTKARIDELYTHASNYRLQNPWKKSSLNTLRQQMAIQVIQNIRTHHHSRLFYIEAPTGGGKTNLSLLAVLELLKLYEDRYNKVYYVFPFTTLITQTYAYIRDMLALDENELIEVHSRSPFKEAATTDDQYGSDQLNYIYYLFVLYPFCLLTHIRFFDILKTNEKEANYLLHRLANSIVVIDELQSYNPEHWDKLIYFIRQYAQKFNIKFILMSATLPKLDKLKVIKDQVQDFVYLLPDAKERYFNNPNFSQRVEFNFDLLARKRLSLKDFATAVTNSSKEYSVYDFGEAKPMGSVYTIVEFIYKQTVVRFSEIIEQLGYFDRVFVLSGTILEHRRREVIQYLKDPANRAKKIILITTQVVEAGVDIDMDIGFKDRSIIDSDEQLAGRTNRNMNKAHCMLYLFKYDRASTIYGKDKRLEITSEEIDTAEYQRILQNKDFDALYDRVFDKKNAWNETEMAENFSDYKELIKRLKFRSVHQKFRLIEQKNLSCFIPVNIPFPAFTASQLDFLRINTIVPDEYDTISGEQVFDLYLKFIRKKIEFTQQRIRVKQLQAIMAMFTISLFSTEQLTNQLATFTNIEKSQYGYQYIQNWPAIYSLEKGLDKLKLDGTEESQFL